MSKDYKKIFLFFIIISTNSCGLFHYSLKDMNGAFVQTLSNGMQLGPVLYLYNKKFVLKDSHRYAEGTPFICCDTIACGEWEIDNVHGVLVLNSDNSSAPILDLIVKEGISKNADSLYFYIINPIEKFIGKQHEDLEYNLLLSSTQMSQNYSFSTPSENLDNSVADKFFDTNKIVIANPDHLQIKSFLINIIPKNSFRGRDISIRTLRSVDYKVVNYENSNVFYVEMPKLTYSLITYLRWNDEFIKILNKNKLELDGKYYIRKDNKVE